MTLSAHFAPPAMGLPQTAPATSSPGAITHRLAVRGAIARDEDYTVLSWIVAIAASFLAIGMVGVFEPQGLVPILLSGAKGKGANEIQSVETTMAELQAQSQPTEVAIIETPPETIEVPPLEFIEQPLLDLPELTEALITEDVFTVPAAPRIEEALKPIEAAPPKPVVHRPARPSSGPPSATTTRATSSGGGGNAATGSGGRGTFPEPPYPSFARSRGIQGTCTLSIRVGPSGAVEGVSVSSSTGFSDLDRHASSWVRRNWRWPVGGARSFNLPVSFRLR